MNLLTKGLVATAVVTFFGAALAASPRSVSFDEVVKLQAKGLKSCKKDRGIVTTISSAKMDNGGLHIQTAADGDYGSMYEMKAPATAEQLKLLVGAKTCFVGGD
jgi:hypothetical protein